MNKLHPIPARPLRSLSAESLRHVHGGLLAADGPGVTIKFPPETVPTKKGDGSSKP